MAGGPFGSTYVDNSFLNEFLPRRLGQIDYHNRMYNPDMTGQGGHRVLRPEEQQLLRKFMDIKHDFEGRRRHDDEVPDQFIPLPENVSGNIDAGSSDGNLRITWFVFHLYALSRCFTRL